MIVSPRSVESPPATCNMVTADGTPLVETCVLLPVEFALKVETQPRVASFLNLLPQLAPRSPLSQPLLDHFRAPSFTPLPPHLGSLAPALSPLGPPLNHLVMPTPEDCIQVCATRLLPPHTRYLPFSGTVRTDNLPLVPCLPPLDPRQRYGSYDEVCQRPSGRVRLCNWVRFVSPALHFTPQVNMVASRVRGSAVFEVVREVSPGERLVALLLPDVGGEDSLLLPALSFLRSSLYRHTMDSIISEAPLDLSRSLLTSSHSPHSAISTGGSKRKPEELSPRHSPSSPSPTVTMGSVASSLFPARKQEPSVFPQGVEVSGRPSFSHTTVSAPSTSDDYAPPSRISMVSTTRSSEVQLTITPTKRRERTMLPCSDCGKAFDRPSLLKRHIRTHTGEKPHTCDVCGKGFSTSSSLNTHRRIHSGEKPHQCGVCGKRFTASSNLYYHKMTHVKEKPHKCSLCTRSFPTPGDLRSHMFVHNGQWPHKCSICGKGFSKLTNLRNHALLHAEVKRNEPSLMMVPLNISSALESPSTPSATSFLTLSTSQATISTSPLPSQSQTTSLFPSPSSSTPSPLPTAEVQDAPRSPSLRQDGCHSSGSASIRVRSQLSNRNESSSHPSHTSSPTATSSSSPPFGEMKRVSLHAFKTHTYTRFFLDDLLHSPKSSVYQEETSMPHKYKDTHNSEEENSKEIKSLNVKLERENKRVREDEKEEEEEELINLFEDEISKERGASEKGEPEKR